MTTVTEESRTFSRRTIVKGAGAIVVALGVPGLGAKAAHAAPTVVNPLGIGPASIDPNQIDSWFAIGTDGTVTLKAG